MVSLSISAATNRITTSGFAYDAAGNLVHWPGGTVTIGAEYDVDGRLSMVKEDGVAKYNYAYDARNRRVRRKDVSGNPPRYEVYGPGGELLGVYGGYWYWSGGQWNYVFRVEEERVYFAGRVVARLDESGSAIEQRMDRLGSVKAWQRYPFGEGNESNTYDEYATYPVDRSTGHYYAWNRFYSATWGRFSSPDPYVMSGGLTHPQGWNRYSYVANDPVNYYDPHGLWQVSPITSFPIFAPSSSVTVTAPFPTLTYAPPGAPDLMGMGVARVWDDSDMEIVRSVEAGEIGGVSGEKQPECFAQLKYRDVVWAPERLLQRGIKDVLPANHTFWWVQDRNGNHYIINAGPEHPDGSGHLVGGVYPGDAEDEDNARQPVAWSSGLSSSNCDSVDRMLEAARSFPQDKFMYRGWGGPNSNSFARYIGRAGGFQPTPPPLAIGWNNWLDLRNTIRRRN